MRILVIPILTLAGFAAAGPPQRHDLAAVDVPSLQRAFMKCEHQATQTILTVGDAAGCSMLYEELKQRGFGGDHARFMAWWRTQRGPAASPPP